MVTSAGTERRDSVSGSATPAVLVLEVLKADIEQEPDVGIVERVVDVSPLLSVAHQPRRAQQPQVVRASCLGKAGDGGQVADAQLTFQQGDDQPYAARVGEHAERLRESLIVPDAYALKGSEQNGVDRHAAGPQSYELFAPVWPGMEDFSHYKDLPKYVVSTTLTDDDLVSDWGPTTILRSLDEVAALKETEGGPIIIHGSVTLNHALADAGLVDRYNLLVFPLLLGAGQKLFSDTDKDTQKLTLVDSEVYSNGIQKNIFDVVH